MPHLPRRLAAGTERLLGHTVCVEYTQQLSDGLLIAMLSGEVFASPKARPAAEVEFRVAASELRHFTLAGVDPESRTGTMILHTRGVGPGREWAHGLRPGRSLRLLGAGDAPVHDAVSLIAGDATAIGLATGLAARARPGRLFGAIEVHPDDTAAVDALLPGLKVLSTGAPGAALTRWLVTTTVPSQGRDVNCRRRPGRQRRRCGSPLFPGVTTAGRAWWHPPSRRGFRRR